MTPFSDADRERWQDLEVARLLFGLPPDEQAEWDALAARAAASPAADSLAADSSAADFSQVVAALDLAYSAADSTPLPAHLRQAVLKRAPQARSTVAEVSPPQPNIVPPRSQERIRFVPWLVAAASLLVALFVSLPRSPRPVDVASLRAELVRTAPDLVQVDWAPGTTPIEGASGDVVWSAERQAGFMRFRGMSVNAPTKEQYQLWIFDKNQSDKTPIDGGVFDIGSDGDVIVPITPKLRVRQAYLFAITVEKPGGVVVSTREQLPLLAKVE